MNKILQMLSRGGEHLLGRFSGPLNFGLLVMPTVVTILAIRAACETRVQGIQHSGGQCSRRQAIGPGSSDPQ